MYVPLQYTIFSDDEKEMFNPVCLSQNLLNAIKMRFKVDCNGEYVAYVIN